MQESRRRRRLELGVLSVSTWLSACGSQALRAPSADATAALGPAAADPAADATPRPAIVARSTGLGGAARTPDEVAPALAPGAGAGLVDGSSDPATPSREAASAEGVARPRELPRDTLVLHVGDSFAGALGVELGKRLKAAGVRSMLQFKTSSYIPTWAFGEELPRFVSNYNPDLVIVTLGANEFDIPDPNQRITAIRRLVTKIGERPCVWISPPRWKSDTGLMAVIREHAAPCRFLDSDTLVRDLPRARDRIHPSELGREIWAAAVFEWLGQAREPAGDKPWALRTGLPEEAGGPSAASAAATATAAHGLPPLTDP